MGWEFPSYSQGGGKAWGFSSRSEKNDWTLTDSSKYTDEVSGSKYKITRLSPSRASS